ncbi:MAG: sigma 54-dependent transcriptional regulator, partial [Verrucomicrobiales bacterium]|nr:sigma 54-dependent transcriptional regulator [Verrucomicrobiales bacterium]
MTADGTVVFGFLGTTLDRGEGPSRWLRWRPTVALCQQTDLSVRRLELLMDGRFRELADQVVADIRAVSPETEVRLHELNIADPWDFQQVYEALYDFARSYRFQEREDYLVHLTTGTHVAQICWFLLTEARYLPARLLQTAPPRKEGRDVPAFGRYEIIDLDLSKYDRLATRFAEEQEQSLDFLKSGIATRNAAFNKMIEQIELVALQSTAPVLLTG